MKNTPEKLLSQCDINIKNIRISVTVYIEKTTTQYIYYLYFNNL